MKSNKIDTECISAAPHTIWSYVYEITVQLTWFLFDGIWALVCSSLFAISALGNSLLSSCCPECALLHPAWLTAEGLKGIRDISLPTSSVWTAPKLIPSLETRQPLCSKAIASTPKPSYQPKRIYATITVSELIFDFVIISISIIVIIAVN